MHTFSQTPQCQKLRLTLTDYNTMLTFSLTLSETLDCPTLTVYNIVHVFNVLSMIPTIFTNGTIGTTGITNITIGKDRWYHWDSLERTQCILVARPMLNPSTSLLSLGTIQCVLLVSPQPVFTLTNGLKHKHISNINDCVLRETSDQTSIECNIEKKGSKCPEKSSRCKPVFTDVQERPNILR